MATNCPAELANCPEPQESCNDVKTSIAPSGACNFPSITLPPDVPRREQIKTVIEKLDPCQIIQTPITGGV